MLKNCKKKIENGDKTEIKDVEKRFAEEDVFISMYSYAEVHSYR